MALLVNRAEADPTKLRSLASVYDNHAEALEDAMRTLLARYDLAGRAWSDSVYGLLGEELTAALRQVRGHVAEVRARADALRVMASKLEDYRRGT